MLGRIKSHFHSSHQLCVCMALFLMLTPSLQSDEMYVVNLGTSSVDIIDTATNTVIKSIPVGAASTNIVFTPDTN